MFQKNDNKSATLSILICAIDLLGKVSCNINENVEDIKIALLVLWNMEYSYEVLAQLFLYFKNQNDFVLIKGEPHQNVI